RKEFIQLFRDAKSRRVLIVATIIQLLVFGYVVNYDISKISVALLDHSRTPESRELTTAFTGNGIFYIKEVFNQNQMEKLLLEGRTDLGIIVPPDYADTIRIGTTSEIQIIVDGTTSNMASIRVSYAMQVLERLNSMLLQEFYPLHLTYGKIDNRLRTWYNPNMDSRYYFVPGIVAFVVMLISLLLTSIAIIKEKEAGTMEQLIVTPLAPVEFITGKTIPYAIISLVQMIAITIFAIIWFRIPMNGSIALLFFATCIFLMSSLGLGLFISTVSLTQQQAMMSTFFFILPIFMLSGFVFPIANMPVIVQWIAYLNPLTHFLIILRGVFLRGAGISVFWPQITALIIIGFLLLSGSVWRFKKRLD
ncbi:MAG: ABC transporter permease, partial [Syntrophales bacterium]|nr:ABC transporter permease [Syntrophales bacterium]